MDSLAFDPGPPSPTLKRLAGGPPHKRVGGWPAVVFYPFGHPTLNAYEYKSNNCGAFLNSVKDNGSEPTRTPAVWIYFENLIIVPVFRREHSASITIFVGSSVHRSIGPSVDWSHIASPQENSLVCYTTSFLSFRLNICPKDSR
jgi:hypothetical protein